jgi:hypothetical protein
VADYTNALRFYENGGQVTDFQRGHLIPRISRILYGEAAPAHALLANENISYHYVMTPETVGGDAWENEYFEDDYRYLAEQAVKMARVHESFEPLVDLAGRDFGGTDAGGKPTAAWNIFAYRYTGLGAVKARLEDAAHQVRRLAKEVDRDEADRLARRVVASLPELQSRVDAVHARSDRAWDRVKPLNPLIPAYRSERLKGLDTFEPSEWAEKFQLED